MSFGQAMFAQSLMEGPAHKEPPGDRPGEWGEVYIQTETGEPPTKSLIVEIWIKNHLRWVPQGEFFGLTPDKWTNLAHRWP